MQILLDKGANVNAIGGPYGNALQAAAWVGNVVIIAALQVASLQAILVL